MTDYSFAIQGAIYQRIKALAGGQVFDQVPDKARFPHIAIGEGQSISDDTSGEDGGVSEFTDLHVWSEYRGQKEVKEIAGQLRDTLHRSDLLVPGRSSAFTYVRTVRIFRDADGVRWHGVVTVETIHRS